MSSDAAHWLWFYDLWRGRLRSALLLVVMTVVSTVVALSSPLIFRSLLNDLGTRLAGADGPTMGAARWHYLGLLLALGLARLVAALYPIMRARMNYIFERTIRARVFDDLLTKDGAFFVRFRTGDLVTRLTDDTGGFANVAWFACSGFFRAFDALSVVACCAGAMVWLDPTLAGLALLPLPLALAAYVAISTRLRRAHETNRSAISLTTNHLESCLSGIRILKAHDAAPREAERFCGVLADRFEREMEVVRSSELLHVFYEAVGAAAQIVVVLAGGLMVIRGSLTLGDYYAFYAYLGIVVYPMLDIPNLLVTSRQAFACVDRLEELRTTLPAAPRPPSGRVLDDVRSLAFEDVSFRYGEGDEVLSRVSFTVERGERLAIVGQIGSGKTTLLNLVAGILSPTRGRVLVDGTPLDELDLPSYRSKLGYIGQDPVVFSETIRQNIRFWRPYDDEAVTEAAERSRLAGEVAAFPERFDQVLGQRGITVSGGQKQRITIARALIGTPRILVMDDVTASLDAEAEEAFWADMSRECGDSIVLIVSHRLATVRRATRILVLEGGRVADQGGFDELAERSPAFATLLRAAP